MSTDNLEKLAALLSRYTPHDGYINLPLPGVNVMRISQVDAVASRGMSSACICIVTQGAKRTIVGQDVYEYDNSRMVIYSTEVPIVAKILKASPAEPYLCLTLDIDSKKLAEVAQKVFAEGAPKSKRSSAVFIGPANSQIVDAAIRLIELIPQPEQAKLLVPLIMEEIYIRLLQSQIGNLVAQIGITDSHLQKISNAIAWLRDNYTEPMKIEELARRVNMSVSSFHHHFKAITSMSPLQFQKELRLHEAKHLMLAKMMDVSTACMHVGYSSVSQFSREYSRLFGQPPSRDIQVNFATPA